MTRTSLPVKLQHDAGTFWGIIIFTRNCKMLPLEHDVVQKVKKVNIKLVRDFGVENISVKLQNDRQFLQSYRIHKAAWPWASLKVQKGHTNVNVKLVRDFYAENIHVKLQHDTGNLQKVIAFTRSSQMLPAWKFIKVTQRSRSNLDEILISGTSLPVQLQHDAGKLWCFIIFTRSCKMLFEHDQFQKSKRSTSNSSTRYWCGEYLCKTTKR